MVSERMKFTFGSFREEDLGNSKVDKGGKLKSSTQTRRKEDKQETQNKLGSKRKDQKKAENVKPNHTQEVKTNTPSTTQEKTQAKANTKTQAKTQAKANTKTQAKTQAKANTKTQEKTKTQAKTAQEKIVPAKENNSGKQDQKDKKTKPNKETKKQDTQEIKKNKTKKGTTIRNNQTSGEQKVDGKENNVKESNASSETKKTNSVPSGSWLSLFEKELAENEAKVAPKSQSNVNSKKKTSKPKVSKKKISESKLKSVTHIETLIKIPDAKVLVTPRGLTNVNNSCFINSVLQALFFVPEFYSLLSKLNEMSLSAQDYPLTHAFLDFYRNFTDMANKDYHINVNAQPFVPESILKYLNNSKSHQMKSGEQHDAEELLRFFLQQLGDELTPLKSKRKEQQQQESDDDWEEVGKHHKSRPIQNIEFPKSLISQIFGGTIRSLIRKKMSKSSLTLQPFFILPVPIGFRVKTIEDCLHELTLQTSVGNRTSQQITFEELPRVLVLQLKRFRFDSESKSFKKIHKRIQYPEALFLDDAIISTNKVDISDVRRYYQLHSVVTHEGEDLSSGHYTSYVKHGVQKWIHIDDAKIRMSSPQQALSTPAYLLFYCQVRSMKKLAFIKAKQLNR